MEYQIKDPEVLMLATIASTLKGDYVREGPDDPWAGSPFAWIRTRPSRQVGKIGEQLVAGWCAAKGLDVTRSSHSEADRVIAGRRVEIKFSTLWESGVYKFQQLRDQDYEFAVCLGIFALRRALLGHPQDRSPAARHRPYSAAHREGWHRHLLAFLRCVESARMARGLRRAPRGCIRDHAEVAGEAVMAWRLTTGCSGRSAARTAAEPER
jgi:hypothetical protein